MKNLLFISIVTLSGLFLLSACGDENEVSSDLITDVDLASDAALESNYEDVDDIIDAGMESASISGRFTRDAILDCALIAKDTVNSTMIIDYGDGCEGPFGRVRKGKIIIEYSDERSVPGAYRIATLEDFYIDSVKVEGTRSLTNISESEEDNPTYSIKLEGGKLTFPDETFASREADHIRTSYKTDNPSEDSVTVEGTANGVGLDGVSYEITIIEPIVYKRDCRGARVFIPVQGVKEITYEGGDSVVLDYGDGTCDNEVSVTVDGVTTTEVIRPRGSK